MAAKLDRSRDFGEVSGGSNGVRFYQDNKPFDGHGNEIVTEVVKPAAPAHPKAHAKAKHAPVESIDAQLASQMADPK